LRWTLTAWYVLVLVLILVLGSFLAQLTVARLLRQDVDNYLRSSASELAGSVNEEFLEGHDLDSGHGGEEEDELAYLSGIRGEFVYAVFLPDGQAIANPLGADLSGFASPLALEEAVERGAAWRTLDMPQGEYRVLYVPVQSRSKTIAVATVGRSLTEQGNQIRDLRLLLTLTGGVGVILAVAGGFLLSGRALEPARLAFERQQTFIADASHELRTPLTLIRASAEALQRDADRRLSEQDQQALSDILAESDRMAGLVRDLLTLARLDAGEPIETRPVDLVDVAREAVRLAGISMGDRLISLRFEEPGGSRLLANINAEQVLGVLRILIDNAVRHTPDGGSISIRVAEAGAESRVSVLDTGPGLRAEEIDSVFERFYRSDSARASTDGGAGLGLSIARSIIERNGGRIWAENRPTGGASFTFALPAGKHGDPAPRARISGGWVR
jgi:signal transduction histidine kinase